MGLKKMVLPLLAAVQLFTACAQRTAAEPPAGDYAITSFSDVPPFEEYSALPLGEIVKIRQGMERIPIDSCEAYYTGLITEFLEEEGLADFLAVREISVEQDSLSLIRGQNRKSLTNLAFGITLDMDITDVPDYFETASAVCQQLSSYLGTNTFYAAKAKTFLISVYDQYGFTLHCLDGSRSTVNEIVFQNQSETEYAAQTVAYSFGEKNSDFVLSKFGAIPDTRELYVEYYVEDGYFGRGAAENQRSIENLETVRDNIKEFLMGKDATGQYIKTNDLEILTISFKNGIFEDSYLTFNSDL